jgi:putative ABC transport system substrate-binding protein
MRRREFITLIGGAGVASVAMWLAVARAAEMRPRVAVLTLLSPEDRGGRTAAFITGMRELGYIPGQTVDFDYRYAYGDTQRLQPLAQELIALGPNVIFAEEPSAARAVKALAPDLPIVCPTITPGLPDLFTSYARPGGSVTGVVSTIEDLNAKLVELAHEVIPGLKLVGLLVNPAGANRTVVAEQIEAGARARGVTTLLQEARLPGELVPALESMAKAGAQVVIVPPNGMFINQRETIIGQALALSLPTVFQQRQDVEAGGFMSYGVNETEGSHRAAAFVDKILKGAKPGDLPIEFATKIELVVNLKTAKALRLSVPPALLARADGVIE